MELSSWAEFNFAHFLQAGLVLSDGVQECFVFSFHLWVSHSLWTLPTPPGAAIIIFHDEKCAIFIISVPGGCTHVKASVFGTKYFPFVPDFQRKIFATVSVTLTLFSYQQRSASEKNVPFFRFSFSFIHLMFVSFHQKTMDWHSPLCTCSWLYISMAAPFKRLCWSHHVLRTITIGLTFVGVNGIAQRMKLGLEIQVPLQGEISCECYIPYPKKNYIPHSWH